MASHASRLGRCLGAAAFLPAAAIIFSFVIGIASRNVCIGVFPKHQRPWCGRAALYNKT
jgi:hypothetical protein